MPTKNRQEWVPRAIRCFQDQTYVHRELLILDNGDSIQDLIPPYGRIRYVRMAGDHKIGNLRNYCCQMARGEFIAHWDDDDWSHPNRLQAQIGSLQGLDVTVFSSMYFHGPGKEVKLYTAPAGHGLGTSLFYRRSWWEQNKFSPQHIGEDAVFMQRSAGNIVFSARTDLMVASTHPNNSSKRQSGAKEWKKAHPEQLPEGYPF